MNKFFVDVVVVLEPQLVVHHAFAVVGGQEDEHFVETRRRFQPPQEPPHFAVEVGDLFVVEVDVFQAVHDVRIALVIRDAFGIDRKRIRMAEVAYLRHGRRIGAVRVVVMHPKEERRLGVMLRFEPGQRGVRRGCGGALEHFAEAFPLGDVVVVMAELLVETHVVG